jgi:hypothetical protein
MKKIIILAVLVYALVFIWATQMIVTTTNGEESFELSEIESITFEQCQIVITNPNSSSEWVQGEDFTIDWENASGSQIIFYLYQDGVELGIAHDWTLNDDTCHGWLLSEWGTGSGYQIYALDSEDNCGWSEEFAIIDDGSVINVTDPNSETIWYQGSDFDIVWSNATGAQVLIELYQNGEYIGVCHNWTANDGTCHGWVVEDWESGINFKVKVIDTSDNYGWSQNFEIQNP